MDNQSTREVGQVSTRQSRIGALVLLGIAIGASVLTWPELPEQMVVRWDASGTADGFAAREVGALGIPLLAIVLLGLFELLPRIDPLGSNVERFRGYYNGFILIITGFLVGIHGAILAVNLGYDIPLTALLVGLIGILFLYVSLLLEASEPNWFVGIRTPWTLSSDTVWDRTHTLGSRLFALAGLGYLLLAFVEVVGGDLGELPIYILIASSVLIAVVTFAHSYYVYATLEHPEEQPK